MDSVAVLIAAPGSGAITGEVVSLLSDLGADAPHWLAPGDAAEVPNFQRLPELMVELRNRPIDVAVISIHNRRKRLLIADMDSTMIRQECIDELGDVAGVGNRIKEITIRAMRGELDFEAALRERVGLLKGLDAAIIGRVIAERLTYMPGGATLVATMRANGAYTALVSGGFRQFTAKVAEHLGFDENAANDLIIENGVLRGLVREPILGKEAKLATLERLAGKLAISSRDVLAVGDGANDIPMLMAAGMGVALHAKPSVQKQASIAINHADLTALLYLQGYSMAQFEA